MRWIAVVLVVLVLMCGLVMAGCGSESGARGVSSGRTLVGVWQGEAAGYTVQFCFREDGSGFINTSSWAGGETNKFTWKDAGDRLAVQGKDIGGYGKNSAEWKYEWMDKNLVIHLDGSEISVICSRVPEKVGG